MGLGIGKIARKGAEAGNQAVEKMAEAGNEVYKAVNRGAKHVARGVVKMKDDAVGVVDAYRRAPDSQYGIPMNIHARKQLKEIEDDM